MTAKQQNFNDDRRGASRPGPSPALLEELNQIGISPRISRALPSNILALSEVQRLTIPRAIEGEDLVMLGRTGDGKTLAYGIPMFERLLKMPQPLPYGVGLIVVPSSHLASQVREALRGIADSTGILTQFYVEESGTRNSSKRAGQFQVPGQFRAHVAVGTPRALLQASRRGEFIPFDSAIVVLDEADLLLGDELCVATMSLLGELRPFEKRQTILATATLPNEVIAPVVEIAPGATVVNAGIERPVDRIEHLAVLSGERSPYSLVTFLIQNERIEKGIVFCLDARDCEKLSNGLNDRGIAAAPLYAKMSEKARFQSIQALRDGEITVLVSTVQEGRGLDVSGMTHVINFDVPLTISNYLQQSGRTGRAGQWGTCFTVIPGYIRREFDSMMAVLRISPKYISTEYQSKGQVLEFAPTPDSPERIVKVIEEHCDHSFLNPGLVLTAMDRNRRFADARETAVLLNIVGREVGTLIRHQIKIAAEFRGVPLASDLTMDAADFSRAEMSRLISALEVTTFVNADKAPSHLPGVRVPNAEQAIFNLLGAILIDSANTEKAIGVVGKALGVEGLLRIFDSIRPHIGDPSVKFDDEVLGSLQGALGYQFTHPNLISTCLAKPQGKWNPNSNRVAPFTALGNAVLQIFMVDAVRRSYVDGETGFIGSRESANLSPMDVPRFIRQRRDILVQLRGRWETPEFSALDFAFRPLLGDSPSSRPDVGNKMLARLIGAVFVDGGYPASQQCLERLLPDLKFNSDRAAEVLLAAFDPARLQECLTEAGEARTARLEAQERAKAGQLVGGARKRPQRTTGQPTLPEVDFEALLRAAADERNLKQFKISTTWVKLGNSKIYTTAVLWEKREHSSHTDIERKSSIQTACRAALGVLKPPMEE
jgi:ATP-dependent RNA helicase RhlE